jgi:hypothetical protein
VCAGLKLSVLLNTRESAGAHPPDHPLSIESRMAWHVREILLQKDVNTLSPALKDKLRPRLGLPEPKRSIPVVKTEQYPAQAMHINVSNNSGNVVALENLLEQGGADPAMLKDHVVVVHGDLGSGEHIENIKGSRSIEETPQNRLQHIQYVPGFLHLEMAITDGLWRLYLENQDPGSGKPMDPNSIFHLCSLLRPRDSKKLATNPDHRMEDRALRHALTALIADAWRIEVESKHNVAIGEWLPTWEEIIEISRQITRTHVAEMSFVPSHTKSPESSDMANDNVKLFARDVLLWVMVRHASRHGDVGCIEDLLPFWICIWAHTGKHKYAEYIAQFLLNLNRVWPEKFANVVRMNWLVNPTGVFNGFRGADWVVERNNMMHKVIHSGGGANRTLDNIIKESTLILVFQRAHEIIERNFHITKSTLHHAPPSMENTLGQLQMHIRQQQMHSHIHGRKLSSLPANSIVAGLLIGLGKSGNEPRDEEDEEDPGSDGMSVVTASDREDDQQGDRGV